MKPGLILDPNHFSCCIVGQTSLTLQCAVALSQTKFYSIQGVVTTNPKIRQWAKTQGIPCSKSLSLLEKKPVDYLFSIINYDILPQSILQQVRRLAINFHDSLLPRYAGLYATSWALLGGETQHGITWHVISNLIDGGDILKQGVVEISPQETAFSLNLKCYEQGKKTFLELLEELQQGTYKRTPQQLAKRSYFGVYHKPPLEGFIDWHSPALDIDRLVRALDFGNQPNPLASAKLIFDNKVYLVKSLSLTQTTTGHPPGHIINCTPEYLEITTATQNIKILQLQKVQGRPHAMSQIYKRYRETPNKSFLETRYPFIKHFLSQSDIFTKNEPFWVNQLSKASPLSLPFTTLTYHKKINKKLRKKIIFPPQLIAALKKKFNISDVENILLSGVFYYLYRLSTQETISVSFYHTNLYECWADYFNFLSARVIFTVNFPNGFNFKDLVNQVITQRERLKQKITFRRDIFSRYPALANTKTLLPIKIILSDYSRHTAYDDRCITWIISSKKDIELNVCLTNLDNTLWQTWHALPTHLLQIFNSLVTESCPFAQTPLLSKVEQKKLLLWNNTKKPFPSEETLHGWFEKQVAQTPNQSAVYFEQDTLTYTQLNERANQVRDQLITQGIPVEGKIGLLFERSLEIPAAMLGVLKAGGCYIPIDPRHPTARIKLILEDAKPFCILTHSSIPPHFFDNDFIKSYPLVFIDKLPVDPGSHISPPPLVHANHLAYIMYTSGSTGIPKGVMLEHRAVVNRLFWMQKHYHLKPEDKVLQKTTYTFDVSVWEFFWPLLTGAQLVITKPEGHKDPHYLIETIKTQAITTIHFVPAMLAVFLEMPEAHTCTSLRYFFCSGEALPASVKNKFFKHFNAKLYNLYGPTEAAIDVTYYQCRKYKKMTSIPIGRPIYNTQIYILDKSLQPLPIGISGELYIGGIGLARGYINRPELTAEKFIKNPFSCSDDRLYKSGDLARWLSVGQLEFLGRLDDQVKLHGFRIEMGEIEHALTEYPAIEQAAVVLQTIKNKQQLSAFIVLHSKQDASFDFESVKNFLRSHLPEYMIPTSYLLIKTLPINANGKIDRVALRQCTGLLVEKTPTEKPTTDIQQKLLHVWQKTLGTENVGITDDFFSLGGDSILAMQMIAKAEKDYLIQFSIEDIFQAPTIAELAQRITSLNSPSLESKKISLNIIPLIPIQHWFLEKSWEHANQWSQACLLTSQHPLNKDVLERALTYVIQQHDVFKFSYHKVKGITQWQQKYRRCEVTCIFEVVVTDRPIQSLKNVLPWAQSLHARFDLTTGPLIGAILFQNKHTPSNSHFLIVIHHLLIDGVSWRVLMPQLETVYAALMKQGQPLPHSSPTVDFASWASALKDNVYRVDSTAEKDYWRSVVQTTGEFLPPDCPDGDNSEKNSAYVTLQLSPDVSQALRSRVHGVYKTRINDILLAALLKTCHDLTQKNSLLINLESHGRHSPDIPLNPQNAVGWFTALFPIFLQSNAQDWQSLVLSVKSRLAEVANRTLNYGILRYLSSDPQIRHDLQEATQPTLCFNYWGQFEPTEQKKFVWNEISLLSGPDNLRPHLLTLDCVMQNKIFIMHWSYSRMCYHEKTILTLAKTYQNNLNALIEHCLSFGEKTIEETLVPALTSIEDSYPLTHLQQGFLYHFLQNPNSTAYNIQLSWTMHQVLDLDNFKAAWQLLLQRHGVLRTAFQWEGLEHPTQNVHATVPLPWHFYDFISTEQPEKRKKLQAILEQDQTAPISLTTPPLFRIIIFAWEKAHYKIILRSHHIILDGWSFSLLLSELQTVYELLCSHQTPTLPSPHPFKEYVSWTAEKDASQDKIFWKNYLTDFDNPTELPLVRSAQNIQNVYGSHKIHLSETQSQQIRHFTKNHKITLNLFFQGLWGLLLQRYSQSNDVVFGVTMAGRSLSLPDMEQRIGLFINTVPFRIKFLQDQTVLAYLTQLQNNFLQVLRHQYTSLTDILACSDFPNSKSLFDTLVVFENYPQTLTPEFCDEVSYWDPTHYVLTFIIEPKPSISLKISHAPFIEDTAIEGVFNHLQTLIQSMLDNPTQLVHHLAILNSNEKKRLSQYSQHQAAYPVPTVTQNFENIVRQYPQQIAVRFNEHSLSYETLNTRANQLAHYLIEQHLAPKTAVGCSLRSGIEAIIALLGILKAGATYVPLNPDYPIQRLVLMHETSGIQCIVTESTIFKTLFNEEVTFNNCHFIFLDDTDIFNKRALSNPTVSIPLESPAYILYTSGTTGRPKGVCQTHATLANLSHWQALFCSTFPAKITQFASLSFDVSLQEICFALSQGHELWTISPQLKNSLSEFVTFLNQHHINQVFLPTALLDAFCETGLLLRLPLAQLTDIFVAGEALKLSSTIKLFFTHYTHIRLTNHYGPTETHVASYYPLPADTNLWPLLPPIGTPIHNVSLIVLDNKKQLVPIGIPGELYIGGVSVAAGYVGQTSEAFIQLPSPFEEGSSQRSATQRLYKTGDKVRWLSTGLLEYLGRFDDQIKVRGYRIEPAEIEAVLLKNGQVNQCLVIATAQPNTSPQLIAFIASSTLTQADTATLQTDLTTQLPSYMIPSRFVFLTHMPLTAHGKVDKKTLLSFLTEEEPPTEETAKNESYYDNHLIKICKDILQLKNLSLNDNFFESGGHSLLALKLLLHIERNFNVKLTINDLLSSPKLSDLSQKIQDKKNNQLLNPYDQIDYKTDSLPFPIVPLQSYGDKTPLFLIHPVGGTIFWFIDLAKHLGTLRPVYGIQDPSILSQKIFFHTLEEMAAFYLHCIQKIQPHGPYLIAGASFGATVAFELAKQLHQKKELVGFLGIIDGWAFYPSALHQKDKFQQIMQRQRQELYQQFNIHQLKAANSWITLQWQRNELLWNYALTPLDVELTLFKAQELMPGLEWTDHPTNHWDRYSHKPIRIELITGNHETMFIEPNVDLLAQMMNKYLP